MHLLQNKDSAQLDKHFSTVKKIMKVKGSLLLLRKEKICALSYHVQWHNERQGRLVYPNSSRNRRIFAQPKKQAMMFYFKSLNIFCVGCKFNNSVQYKLHSFRHHFVSMCANHEVTYRKTLACLGHSSSDMFNLYYLLYDKNSHNTWNLLNPVMLMKLYLPQIRAI